MLNYLARRWFLLLMVIALYVAITHPERADRWLGPLRVAFISATTLGLMSLTLSTHDLWQSLRRPRPALLALAISHGVAPPLCFLIGRIVLDSEYQVGLVVAGSVPCTLASAAVWTRLAGGNDAVALLVTMLSNSLVFILTTSWLNLLTGASIEIGPIRMIGELAAYVAAPILLAQGLRNVPSIGAIADARKRTIGVICRLLILLIIVRSALAARKGLLETGESWTIRELLEVAFACVAAHLFLLFLGYLLGGWLLERRADAIAVAFAGSQKTLPVGALIVADYYPSLPLAIVPMLFYHVGQLLIDTYIADHFFYGTPPSDEPVTPEDELEDEPPVET